MTLPLLPTRILQPATSVSDLRLALRSLAKSPGFTATTVVILALGLAGVTALFSTLEAVMFRSLPYPQPDRLVMGRATYHGEINPVASGPDYIDFRDQSRSFAALEAFHGRMFEVSVASTATTERANALLVSPGFFQVLGARMTMGRGFTAEDGRTESPPVAVVSHAFWRKHWGARRDLADCTISVDGSRVPLVGVASPAFRFIHDADIWLPQRPQNLGPRRYSNWLLVGRLRDGIPLPEAQGEVDVIAARLAQAYPDTNSARGLLLTPLQGAVTEKYRGSFGLLCSGAAAVLLIGCANAAGLLLARGAGRQGELAVRAALGASPWRIVRLLLAEAFLVAGLAGLLGSVLALWLQGVLFHLLSIEAVFLQEAGFRWPVLCFVLAIMLLTGLGSGLLPAWHARRPDLTRDLKTGGRNATPRSQRLRHSLVAAQVGLSFALLVVAGLLTRSLFALHRADPGFDPHALLTAEIPISPRTYDNVRRSAIFATLLDEVRGLPGVQAAGLISQLPVRNPSNNVGIHALDNPPASPRDGSDGNQRIVLPGYFAAMRIPLLAGRDFRAADNAQSGRVVIISQALAQSLFPDRGALGRQVVIDGARTTPWEVVGVVGDVKTEGLWQVRGERGAFYRPHVQLPAATMRLAIRTTGDPQALVPPLRALLHRLDPQAPLSGPRTMAEVLDNDTLPQKTQALLLSVFSHLALLLAAVGIHGVLAYGVVQRRRDLGIRLALGATPRAVLWQVVRQALGLTAVGLAGGLVLALAATRFVASLLYGVSSFDPVTLIAVPLLLLLVVAAACWFPARRATQINPVEALRAE